MHTAQAILFKLGSVTIFVVMSALIKYGTQHVPPGQAVFFRSFFAIPIILGWLAARGDLATGWRTRDPLGHFWRGIMGTMAMGLFFAGLALLPLPEVTAIGYATPIFITVFAAMFLNERVRAFRLFAVGLGLIGVMIVMWPRLGSFSGADTGDAILALGAVVTLGGAICAAMAQVYIRKLTKSENTAAIVFWFSVTSSLLGLCTIPFGWTIPPMNAVLALVTAGLIGGVGQIFLTTSYRLADAAVVAPFDYASMLFALVIGYFIFDEVPTVPMLIGAGLVIFAGILIIWRERQLGKQRTSRKAATPGNV
ncbi:MAG: DMT family transporter [Pseudomonadota bacterium]|jgi:drug/metabolite transporter (DMT)-like permease|nr:DMT family transporter [Pseudomonadota bacterium]MEC8796298.1 DMT family transporter [Pseudomonadota bacterium]